MSVEAMAVVGLPLSVVETQLWDITRWPTFLAGLRTATLSSHERYIFTVHQGRKDYDVLVALRWQARDHRFTWRSLDGPPWDGTLRLVPVSGVRTRVFLQRKTYPRSFLASLADLLGSAPIDPGLDLQRLQDRLALLPAPARPAHTRTVDAAERAARTQRIAQESGRSGVVPPAGLPGPRVSSELVVQDPA